MNDIFFELKSMKYPGRGIFMGKSADGAHAVCAYFIMGRSAHSRNRVFTTDGSDVRTEALDKSLVRDPSLIIYTPVRTIGNKLVITNGDQTDTICKYLLGGGSYADALRTRTFEPDAPNYTPRISAVMEFLKNDMSYSMSIIKSAGVGSADAEKPSTDRFFFEYGSVASGTGHLLHTYTDDGEPLPSFTGEPKRVSISGDIEDFSEKLWNALDPENRIALFVREIDIATHAQRSKIINKSGGFDNEW